MGAIHQVFAVTALNFRNLHTRAWSSLVVVVGIACVVGVLLSMMSLTVGLVRSLLAAGDPSRAIVLSQGGQFEFTSHIPRASIAMIVDAPGIHKDSDGSSVADAEILANIPISRKDGVDTNVLLRGFGPKALELRPEFKLLAGRMFVPGKREIVVGRAAQEQFKGLNIADKVILPDGEWPVVGLFSTGGDIEEGEIVADTPTAMAALRLSNFNSITLRLDDANALAVLKNALTTNPALSVLVQKQSDYYLNTTKQFSALFNAIAYAVAGIMAIGAIFGALNTMYSAVDARTREIATLRALGFRGMPIAISVISEAMLLALLGAIIGASIAWGYFNGAQKSLGANVFNMWVSPSLIILGMIWAMLIALLGSLLPAIRATRRPIVGALSAI